MKAVTWHGKRDVRVDDGPRPADPAADRRDRPDHLDRTSAGPTCTCTRRSARSWARATSSATSRWASSRRSAARSPTSRPGDRVVMPFQISCGHCFMCDQAALHPVRDHPGPRAGHGRGPVRLLQALRRGAGRPGRVPPGAAGAVHAHQGARRPAGRALRLPLRRAADRVAGGRVRRRPGGRQPWSSSGSGPIGDMAARDRPAPWARPGHRRRPGARAPRARPPAWHRGPRPQRARRRPGRRASAT